MKNSGLFRIYFVVTALFVALPTTKAQIQTKPIINASLTGTILDASTREAIPGVTVQLEGVTHQVKTDRDGQFQFVTGQKLPFTITVSYVGYATRKLVVETSPTVIELTPMSNALEQVLVTCRARFEQLQDIQIPVSIVRSATIEDASMFKVTSLKEVVSPVKLYSSNLQHTTLNINGLGST